MDQSEFRLAQKRLVPTRLTHCMRWLGPADLCRVLDDAIQLHGGLGYSNDLPFARWYRWARAARIADGPDEVHQMVIAREFFKDRLELLV